MAAHAGHSTRCRTPLEGTDGSLTGHADRADDREAGVWIVPRTCWNEERGFNDCMIEIEEGTAGRQDGCVWNKLPPVAVNVMSCDDERRIRGGLRLESL